MPLGPVCIREASGPVRGDRARHRPRVLGPARGARDPPPMTPTACQVLLLADTRALERTLDYLVPAEMAAQVVRGSLVACPLGPRRLVGVVMGTDPPTHTGRLVPLAGVVETPPVREELIDLALWVARYYAAPVSACLRLVMPPGSERALGRTPDGGWRLARPPRGPAPVRWAVWAPGCAAADGRRAEVVRVLREAGGAMPAAQLERAAGTTGATLRRMAADGQIAIESRTPDGSAHLHHLATAHAPARPPQFTERQQEAIARITHAMDDGTPALLLHGVTGSGKTEVYLQAIAHARAAGRGSIVLAPEISLTPQLVARVAARLGERVALWHSAMTPAERADAHRRLRSGEADVVVGARSAVFAPVAHLGLVIVDEEHDGSYKQDSVPRYDARQVAYRRAARAGALVVYGSATPRPETWRSLPRVALPERVDGSAPPRIRVVDMRTQGAGPISRPLARALRDAVRDNQKAILLLNRRGFALSALCRACGWVAECPHCDVSLVHHRDPPRLICHHCGHERAVPSVCPQCRSVDLLRAGVGTEGLEAALARVVPTARLVRMDASSTTSRGSITRLLDEFAAPGAAVLLGTQMVAKGHDLRDVTVAAILDADASLRMADFRAEERTFDLIVQTAGRAGRRGEPATVIVQALEPDARAVQLAAASAVEEFLEGELERRAEFDLPPFSHLVRLVVDAPTIDAAVGWARTLADHIADTQVAVMGPAPLHRLRGRARRSITVRAARAAEAVGVCQHVLTHHRAALADGDVRVSIDVDPQG